MLTSRVIVLALAAATFLLTPQTAEAAILPRSEKTTVERMQDGAQDAFDATKNGVAQGLDAVGLDPASRQEMADNVAEGARERAEQAKTATKQTMHDVGKAAERKRQDAATTAQRMAEDGQAQAHRSVNEFRDSVDAASPHSGVADAAMRSAASTGRAAKEAAQDAATSARRSAEDAATNAGRQAEDAKDAAVRAMPEL